jgi:hypothetical protein
LDWKIDLSTIEDADTFASATICKFWDITPGSYPELDNRMTDRLIIFYTQLSYSIMNNIIGNLTDGQYSFEE